MRQAATMTVYSGLVRDALSETGLPGATVTAIANGLQIGATAADNSGNFELTVLYPADVLRISNVGYKTHDFPAATWQRLFELERQERVLDPVILPPGTVKKNNTWQWLLIAGLLLVVATKK